MRNRLLALAFVFAALTGAAFLYQSVNPPVGNAQLSPPAQNPGQAQTAPQATPPSSPSLTAPTSGFNYGRAKLENERNTVEVVESFDSSIGYITAKSMISRSDCDPYDLRCRYLQQNQGAQQGTGSGFVIDDSGLMLTNNHVVTLDSANVGTLTVKFHNDPKTYEAKVVGRSPAYDVALIQVEAPGKTFSPVPLGDSDTVRVGQKAIAMGNPFGLEFSVTEGIISATGRDFQGSGTNNLATNVIQTDAAVNPGNSGGPLLNSSGEVVGINTAILSPGTQLSGTGQFAGIAFAVPINLVKSILDDLKAGKVLEGNTLTSSRPRLGVSLQPMAAYPDALTQQYNLPSTGLMITQVEPGSPAAKAGLRASSRNVNAGTDLNGAPIQAPINGDVILKINGEDVQTAEDMQRVVFNTKVGDTVTLTVSRGGKQLEVQVKPQIIPTK
jgi:serine protease Do